ncbi:MAG TPA: hypothetical protein VFR81_09620 [Longimicrobium sp.]|nr:hypothetical protein [Longimicrobium sp.]
MATRRAPDIDPSDRLGDALSAAEQASEAFTQAKTELLHRLADIDGAVLDIVERAWNATPPEFQRCFLVHMDGGDEELSLPDFLRLLIERPGGTEGTFTISVPENLYDDSEEGDDEDTDYDAADEEEDEDEDDVEPEPPPPPPPPPSGRRRSPPPPPPPADEVDDELGF